MNFNQNYQQSVSRTPDLIRIATALERRLTHGVFYGYFGPGQRVKMIGKNSNYVLFRIDYLLIIQQSIRYFLLTHFLKVQVPDLFGIQINRPTQGALSYFDGIDYLGNFSAIDILYLWYIWLEAGIGLALQLCTFFNKKIYLCGPGFGLKTVSFHDKVEHFLVVMEKV